jgi:hypothetical protein
MLPYIAAPWILWVWNVFLSRIFLNQDSFNQRSGFHHRTVHGEDYENWRLQRAADRLLDTLPPAAILGALGGDFRANISRNHWKKWDVMSKVI